ncbi:MAG: hypothetical protein HYW52_04345 [Gemmatimonadetes bacterium]|nr:hypothetical protein [Gemmatimonadota bacterium]MBI2404462.1 hypothetical protein [Gemmatimonadota bacterium]MBI2614901.1 hypothetical protein [Gemmatimonadota bacterium]
MSGRSALPFLTVLALVLPGCAGKATYNPWLVPRESFLAGTRIIALSPIRVPDDLEQPGPVEAMFDSLIADAVLFPEIAVVDAPYADGTATWDGTSQAVAGFFTVLIAAIANSDLPAGTAEGLSLDVQIERRRLTPSSSGPAPSGAGS